MTTFRSIKPDQGSRPVKQDKQVDDAKRGLKRKRSDDDDELADTFNPKYLTSRDLFELEISDLSFRRHILVQALIIMDFLLSLSPKAKEKLNTAKTQQKSVTYSDQVLSEADTQWAFTMKKTIAEYLRQGTEGPYFFRMVETVLSRDKNWVRWKVENCPSIEMPPVSAQEFNEAKANAQKLATNKRLRPTPLGALSLDFLSDGGDESIMQRFKAQERYKLPDLPSFKRKIADDDFEIEFPTNNQTKAAAVEGKASKSWRALRMASKYKLASFDKIDNPEKIDVIFEEDSVQEADEAQQNSDKAAADPPADRRPVVIVGPAGIGKSSLINHLLKSRSGAFGKALRHVTRNPREGERNGQDYHFVDAQAFSMLRDGDQFLEFSDGEDINHGTSRRVVEAISESGKVPLLETGRNGAQQVKDLGYEARFVLVKPSNSEAFEARLKKSGVSSEKVAAVLRSLTEDAQHPDSTDDFYDVTIINDDLETAGKALEAFIYGSTPDVEQANGTKPEDKDIGMQDVAGRTGGEPEKSIRNQE